VLLTALNSRTLQLCSEGGYKNQKHSTKRGRVGSYECAIIEFNVDSKAEYTA